MTLVLLSLLEAKDEYDKAPILLKKIANLIQLNLCIINKLM